MLILSLMSTFNLLRVTHFYCPQTKFAKVMFLHLSVILFTGGGSLPQCMLEKQTPPQGAGPPGAESPLHSACWEIRPTSGRYASYWNAYLFSFNFTEAISSVQEQDKRTSQGQPGTEAGDGSSQPIKCHDDKFTSG